MVRLVLIEFMEENFLFEFNQQITDDTDLFKEGIIDSFGYIQLMNFIQETFDFHMSRDELLSDIVTTLAGITNLVESNMTENC